MLRYLGDTISAGGGVEAAVNARIRGGLRKFRELFPPIDIKRDLSPIKGKTSYNLC